MIENELVEKLKSCPFCGREPITACNGAAAPVTDEGRDPLSSVGMLRLAIENQQRRWFCSGSDCEVYDHGRDEGLKLALDAFDRECARQLGEIVIVPPPQESSK
jgi:uncharacterized Zn-finger protein